MISTQNLAEKAVSFWELTHVYRIILGVVCRSQNNAREILNLPIREPARKKVSKYGIGKQSVEFIFTNIMIFVIDIPLPDRIFSACFWTSCVGTIIMTVSLRHGEMLALNLSYCILGKK
jgi:hypothetical protein